MRRVAVTVCLGALLTPPVAGAQTTSERVERVIVDAPSGITQIEGIYRNEPDVCEAKQRKPLRAKYRGRLEFIRESNGRIAMINQLSFGHYLSGLAEVPAAWPDAALEAQAIAARSYAFDAMRRRPASARRLGYDICATDQCQVYRGATVELGAFGERWVGAVDSTKGRVLTYRDRVIQAFYFSTSDGRTRRSFPGGTPQPWLPSVDGEDADAPLARWTVRMPLSHLTAMLRARGQWPSGPRITSAVSSGSENVRLRGGTVMRTMSKRDLRIAINDQASCLYPDRYPTNGSAIRTRLPQTVPSATFTVTQNGSTLVLRGRGWGHGVGMSQWGARSLAARGRSSAQILGHYYGPATVDTLSEPDAIRVLAADDMITVRLTSDEPLRVRTDTGSVLSGATSFEIRGGTTLRISRGRGPALTPVLQLGAHAVAAQTSPGGAVMLGFTISRPSRVSVVVSRDDSVVVERAEESFVAGDAEISLPMRDASGMPLASGAYDAVVSAYDGLDRVRSEPLALFVVEPPPPPPPPASPFPWVPTLITAGAIVVMMLGAGRIARARRQPKVNV